MERLRNRFRGIALAAGIVSTLAALTCAPVITGEAGAQEAGQFMEEVPEDGGVARLTWTGGQIEDLDEAAPGALSFWVELPDRTVVFIPGAPDFVNRAFFEAFPTSDIPVDQPMLVILRRIDFDETGVLVRDLPGLPHGAWHLAHEQRGEPARSVRLKLTHATRCLVDEDPRPCGEMREGARARVTGYLLRERESEVVRAVSVQMEP